jgi:hypothetical protein
MTGTAVADERARVHGSAALNGSSDPRHALSLDSSMVLGNAIGGSGDAG